MKKWLPIIVFLILNQLCQAGHLVDSLYLEIKQEKDSTILVKLLNAISWSLIEENPDSARRVAQRSYQIATKSKNLEGIADSKNRMGYAFENQGMYVKALECYLESLDASEQANYLLGTAAVLNNLGVLYRAMGKQEQGMIYLNRSIEKYKILKSDKDLYAGFLNLGACYKDLGNFDKALQSYLNALPLAKLSEEEEDVYLTLNNIGDIYEAMEEPNLALKYYNQAYNGYKSLNQQQGEAMVLIGIGHVHIMWKNPSEGIKFCLQGLEIAKEISAVWMEIYIYDFLYQGYEKLNDQKNAFFYYKKYISIRDSISSTTKASEITRLELQYKFDKQQQALELSQRLLDEQKLEKLRVQGIKRNSIIVAFLLLFITVALIYRNLKLKKKSNTIISEHESIAKLNSKKVNTSINYASKIQNTILLSNEQMHDLFEDYFVLYIPKDVVSGDFYWARKTSPNKLIFAVADCTGHDVQGALMSTIGSALLNQIILENKIEAVDLILNQLTERFNNALKQSEQDTDSNDSMAIAICVLDTKSNTLEFSGANNGALVIAGENRWNENENSAEQQIVFGKHNQGLELKPNRQTIGYNSHKPQPFRTTKINVKKGDSVYLYSDGFSDQKGGVKKRKFYQQPFKDLLITNQHLPMKEQEACLRKTFNSWKSNSQQIDDVCIMGVRI